MEWLVIFLLAAVAKKGGGPVRGKQPMQQVWLLARDDDATEERIWKQLKVRGAVDRISRTPHASGEQWDILWRPNSAADANFEWGKLKGVNLQERRSGAQ